MTLSTKPKNFQKLKHRMYQMLKLTDNATHDNYSKKNFNETCFHHHITDNSTKTNEIRLHNETTENISNINEAITRSVISDFDHILDTDEEMNGINFKTETNHNEMFTIIRDEREIRHHHHQSHLGEPISPFSSTASSSHASDFETSDHHSLAGSNSNEIEANQQHLNQKQNDNLFPQIDIRQFDRDNPMFISLTPASIEF